jgi:hypothetical protein
MKNYRVCEYLNGKVVVVEYTPPYQGSTLDALRAFVGENTRRDYAENYADNGFSGSIWELLNRDELCSLYFLYMLGELTFVSGTRVVGDQLMIGVRMLSNVRRKEPWVPYHVAYVVPRQIEFARRQGFLSCFASYNVGVRTNFYERMLRLKHTRSNHPITLRAREVVWLFTEAGIQEINGVMQHVLSLELTPSRDVFSSVAESLLSQPCPSGKQ